MYERFTDRARKVMQLANQEAQRFNHEYLGTEHVLLGLVKEGSGVAANVLKNLDINLNKIRLEVEKIVQTAPGMVTIGKLPQTPRAKKVIECAIEEATNLNHNYIGTEHLLLGLLREQEGVAAQVLMNLGLQLEDVREEVLNLLGHNMATEQDGERRGSTGRSLTPALTSFSHDLTALARAGKLAPVVGRATEIEQALLVLSCRTRRCPLLLGKSGAGKTAIAEGLAQLIARGDGPALIHDKRLLALDVPMLLLGARHGQLQERLKAVVNEASRAKDVILFLDELHLLDASVTKLAPLAHALASGVVPCLAAATGQTLPRFAALSRRFAVVPVAPLNRPDTLAALRGHRQSLEAHHHVQITDGALEAAAALPEMGSPGTALDRDQPGRAISALDLAGSLLRLRSEGPPPDNREADARIEHLNLQKESAVADQDFDRAAQLRDQADKIKKEKERALRAWREAPATPHGVVDEGVVAEAVRCVGGAAPDAFFGVQ
jgi:ATP-dependent Clp protease ATP-binding subunit ClpC